VTVSRCWATAAIFSLVDTGYGMGAACAAFVDYDRNGDLYLFMTHLRGQTHALYLNQGGFFTDSTASAGLAVPVSPITKYGDRHLIS